MSNGSDWLLTFTNYADCRMLVRTTTLNLLTHCNSSRLLIILRSGIIQVEFFAFSSISYFIIFHEIGWRSRIRANVNENVQKVNEKGYWSKNKHWKSSLNFVPVNGIKRKVIKNIVQCMSYQTIRDRPIRRSINFWQSMWCVLLY